MSTDLLLSDKAITAKLFKKRAEPDPKKVALIEAIVAWCASLNENTYIRLRRLQREILYPANLKIAQLPSKKRPPQKTMRRDK